MVKLIQRVTAALRQSFPNSRVELEQASPAQKVAGFLIWQGFEGQEQIKRQRQMWKILREHLTKQEQLQITAILTATPDEMPAVH